MSRIVVLSRRNITHPRGGGASRYIHEIFRRLATRHIVTVLSEGSTSSPTVERTDGVIYRRFPRTLNRILQPIRYVAKFANSADVLVDNADVGIPWLSPLYSRIPRIVIIHQLVREIFYKELSSAAARICFFAEPALYRLYSGSTIVAMSNSTKKDLCELGIPDENIRIIGPGCPYPGNQRVPLEERSQNLVGCVSRLMRYKGVQFIIKAIPMVAQEIPDVRLEVAGSGPYEADLRKLVHEEGVDSRVHFLGRVPEDRKLKLYCNSRVLVLSSIREGYGLAVIEANSMGTPVVGWNVPGLRDSIIDNSTGLLASFPHTEDLARRICRIMKDDSSWNRMSEQAWHWAQSHSWDRSAREFEDAIELVLSKGPGTGI